MLFVDLRFRPELRFKFIRTGVSGLNCLDSSKTVVAKSRHTVKFFELNNFKIFDIFWISKKISILAHFEIFTVQFHPCPGRLKEIMNYGTFTKNQSPKTAGYLWWPFFAKRIYFQNFILLPKQTFLNEHVNGTSCVLSNMFHLRIF